MSVPRQFGHVAKLCVESFMAGGFEDGKGVHGRILVVSATAMHKRRNHAIWLIAPLRISFVSYYAAAATLWRALAAHPISRIFQKLNAGIFKRKSIKLLARFEI